MFGMSEIFRNLVIRKGGEMKAPAFHSHKLNRGKSKISYHKGNIKSKISYVSKQFFCESSHQCK